MEQRGHRGTKGLGEWIKNQPSKEGNLWLCGILSTSNLWSSTGVPIVPHHPGRLSTQSKTSGNVAWPCTQLASASTSFTLPCGGVVVVGCVLW